MKEFVDFLGEQPPFDALDAEDLTRLAARVEVEYFATGAVVVAANEQLDHLWVVRTGALAIVDHDQVIDLLGPGDLFGHVALLSHLPAGVVVRADEESLCLRIADPRQYLAHPERLRFGALEGWVRPSRLAERVRPGPVRPLARLMRPIVWCEAGEEIRDVALRIGHATHSCALMRTGREFGIVTDHDFRRRVATGELRPDAPVADLATVPALTIDEGATTATGLLQMVEHGVHHLVVVDSGGVPVGVVRAVDLAQADVRDPLLVRSAIESASTLDTLAEASQLVPATLMELCDNRVPATHIGAVHTAIVEAIVRRALALRPGVAGTEYSWVLLGSLARREPLPRSDVDTAIVWADPATADPATADPGLADPGLVDAGDPGDAIRAAARATLDDLRRCGLRPCANGANADNPLFSRSRSAWAAAASRWLDDPTVSGALLLSAMVADSRPLTNLPLGRSLTDTLRRHTRTAPFLRALLDEALGWHPPTGFVRDFVVQRSGEHRGELDLKRGGLAPVVALARWIAVVTGDARGSTPQRLARGAEAGLLSTDESQTLSGAFELVYSLVLEHEVRAIRAGTQASTFLSPRELDTLTRRQLRECFRVIGQIQGRVNQDWIWRVPG